MLSGKLVRVRHARNRLIAQYIDPEDGNWLDVAQRLLLLFRDAKEKTRGELEADVEEVFGDNPTQLVHQGLAKLLFDRCTFEVQSERSPEEIRERAFAIAAQERKSGKPFDRNQILEILSQEFSIPSKEIEECLFADLKDQQRLMEFEDCTPSQLLHRYNVSLAQAILLRATSITILIRGESPNRYRQLFRAIKFHRLICDITPYQEDSYQFRIDGPLSLFTSTQKYGLQLALFLPSLLLCQHFELTAHVRWGTQRKEKIFTLDQKEGLQSHHVDYGNYLPKEVEFFVESFQAKQKEWMIQEETIVLPVGDTVWIPDVTLVHIKTKKQVYLGIYGFWRRTDVSKQVERLQKHLKERFILAISDQYQIDEEFTEELGEQIYRFRRTPIVDEIIQRIEHLYS